MEYIKKPLFMYQTSLKINSTSYLRVKKSNYAFIVQTHSAEHRQKLFHVHLNYPWYTSTVFIHNFVNKYKSRKRSK